MTKLTFTQLIDIEQIQHLLEAQYKVTGVCSAILDTNENILAVAGWQDICTQFHRTHPGAMKFCRESDAYIKAKLPDFTGEYLDYTCKNGLRDVAVPIIIDGEHLATFFTGQFFYDDDKSDVGYFREQARQYGFDEESYLAAFRKVPIFTREQIRSIMDYYRSLVRILAEIGLKKLQLAQEVEERKRAEKALKDSETTLRSITISARDAIVMIDDQGQISFWNTAAVEMLGWDVSEVMGRDLQMILAPESHHSVYRLGMQCFGRTGQGKAVGKMLELLALHKDKSKIPVEVSLSTVKLSGHWHGIGIIRDISERKRTEASREATIELLRICNKAGSKRELMLELTGFFLKLTGCETVGVRLRDGDDFPYYETHGLSEDFVIAENHLCAYDQAGEMVRDSVGHPFYACMCGNIISGRFDPAKPFFTSYGSFWTCSTTELLASTSDEERQAKTRNRCNGEGYESVALVPIRSHSETFGLFQFNDRRKGRFTAEKIALLESLVAYVAIALAKLRVEGALLESNQFSQQIIANAGVGVIVWGPDQRFQVWNPYMEKLCGLMAADVLGRHTQEVFSFVGETEIPDKLGKALNGVPSPPIDVPFQSPDGRWGSTSNTYAPLTNTKGEIIGVIGTVLDISDKKRAQEELLEVTQRLSLATAAGKLGIWDLDIINDVLVWNDRMFEVYGISRDTFPGSFKGWKNSLHPDDREMTLAAINAAIREDKKYDIEFRIVHPDGAVKFIKSNALVIRDEEGNAVRMTGMNQDISERKLLEEQLRHSQKMEAIGQLAGGVAHDFNNILTAIYGHCSMLQMKMGKDAPFRSDIDQIYAAAERAAKLTRSLLAFSRKQIMSPKKVNLNEIIMNVGKLLTRIIGEDIRFKTALVGKPLRIIADSGQIEQVLMNLAANARDAMPTGGILTIETELHEIDESFIHAHGYGVSGKYVVLSISDTGIGMNAETSKKIFEPFFTTKEVGKGTGLGLSIVYGVIKQHNGYINVYSEPNEGTTFRIYLPLVNEEDTDIEEEAVPDYPRMGSETVLVAEDDAKVRELAESILKKFGYDVILAHDGEDAVEKFKAGKEKIAMIVMDMIMPGKSGKEAYEEIRKVRADVKILFVSGYSPDILQNKGIFDNRGDILVKPIHPLDLVRKVRAVLDFSP